MKHIIITGFLDSVNTKISEFLGSIKPEQLLYSDFSTSVNALGNLQYTYFAIYT